MSNNVDTVVKVTQLPKKSVYFENDVYSIISKHHYSRYRAPDYTQRDSNNRHIAHIVYIIVSGISKGAS